MDAWERGDGSGVGGSKKSILLLMKRRKNSKKLTAGGESKEALSSISGQAATRGDGDRKRLAGNSGKVQKSLPYHKKKNEGGGISTGPSASIARGKHGIHADQQREDSAERKKQKNFSRCKGPKKTRKEELCFAGNPRARPFGERKKIQCQGKKKNEKAIIAGRKKKGGMEEEPVSPTVA